MNNSRPKIYTIPFSDPFAERLASRILARFGAAPEVLSGVLVLLPSRRACRALKTAFLEASGGKPLLLPRIQPLGDIDEEEVFFAGNGNAALLEKPAPALRRQMLMATCVQAFSGRYDLVQNHFDQSVWLAGELLKLLDEMEREHVPWANLQHIVQSDYSEHWQVTLDFLNDLQGSWPEVERKNRIESPVRLRNSRMEALAKAWQSAPPNTPVIAAGTTGSIPATAHLLSVISRLPQGEVVLQGVDLQMADDDWETLIPSHPQFGFMQLLLRMKAGRKDIQSWCEPKNGRDDLLSGWMIPAEKTAIWQESGYTAAFDLRGVHVIEAASAQEESAVIAALLRETLEQPGKTAALVTPDRELARRVAAMMRRFGVMLDDSAGIPLSQTQAGSFLHLLVNAVSGDGEIVAMLALLKHPLFRMGQSEKSCRDAARALELQHIRGKFHRDWASVEARMGAGEDSPLKAFVRLLNQNLQSFASLQSCERKVSLLALWNECVKLAETLSASEDGETLWNAEGGETLWQLSLDMREGFEPVAEQGADSFAPLASQLLRATTHRPRYGTHPRLHILSPMEARLLHFDRVILGGLNEDSWPETATVDPWLSRPMREALGLPSPERRVGQSAHDFCQQFASGEVFLTRAEKNGGVQTVASRWLIRLETMLDAAGVNPPVFVAQQQYKRWVEQLNWPEHPVVLEAPAPRPPVAARPRKLSVTQIENLYSNPYKIYAETILRLREVKDIVQEPDAGVMGTVIHAILEAFAKKHPRELPEDIAGELEAIAQKHFAPVLKDSASAIFWHSRFKDIGAWLAQHEPQHRQAGDVVFPETKGAWTFGAPAGAFTLTAKADRIEVHADGSATIIDHKTGGVPKEKDIKSGSACQLPLEALILEHGAFGDLAGVQTRSLQYWQLKGRENDKAYDLKDVPGLIAIAKERLEHVIARFDDASVAYVSRGYVQERRVDETDHLARIKEWAE